MSAILIRISLHVTMVFLGFLTFRANASKSGQRFCPVVTKPAGCTGACVEDFFLSGNPYTTGFS